MQVNEIFLAGLTYLKDKHILSPSKFNARIFAHFRVYMY
jgi:hypothetical protein